MLESLSLDAFTPMIGQSFTAKAGEAAPFELQLTEAKSLLESSQEGDSRSPFSLLFRGPHGPVLDQQIVQLENESLGRLDLFLVPLSADESGTLYEAVFT